MVRTYSIWLGHTANANVRRYVQVTIAALITGYTSLIKAVAYIACQLTGGIVGSLLLVSIVAQKP